MIGKKLFNENQPPTKSSHSSHSIYDQKVIMRIHYLNNNNEKCNDSSEVDI
jgi:hypothetical protein